ncbi:hypothetical protein [Methylobacterium sp. CM6257]
MLVNHERRLLNKAAEASDYRISIRKKPDNSWPSDHSRLTALESVGRLKQVGDHGISIPCVTRQITSTGLTQLQALTGGGE